MKRARAAVAGLSLACAVSALTGLAAASGSPTATTSLPKVIDCVGKPVFEPKAITLSCADANALVKKIRWHRWSTTGASASASFVENTCTPSCAAGRFVTYAATLGLSRPRRGRDGLVFSEATVTFHKVPTRLSTASFTLVTAPLA